jgi:hypothetical protein
MHATTRKRHPGGHPTSSMQLLLPMPTHLALRTRRQATARAGRAGAQHEQRSEETGAGQIANAKWITARQSAPMRERQLVYFQDMPPCSRRRKTIVGGDGLRHFVSCDPLAERRCKPPGKPQGETAL